MDKIKIAHSFSRAAASYDSAAYFQRDIGLQLLSMLAKSPIVQPASNCLDLGCGTGFFRQYLRSLYSHTDYIGIDIAEGMLRFLKKTFEDGDIENDRPSNILICSDAESLPIKQQSIDVVFSNMALQWCESLPALFAELNRILKPGGVVGLTSLGPNTLIELKKSWAMVDNRVHVNPFLPLDSWCDAASSNGLLVEQQQLALPVLRFESVGQLLKELKLIGAHNVNKGRPQGLHAKAYINALYSAYETFKEGGLFPATYEVYFLILRKAY